mgnify:FL=1|tara:strand:+ start:33 stop:188 length:156 start_codon:yes stop_codon:yes gene_type:complete
MDPFIKKFLIVFGIIIVVIVAIGIWASKGQEDTKYSYSQVDSTKTQAVGIR